MYTTFTQLHIEQYYPRSTLMYCALLGIIPTKWHSCYVHRFNKCKMIEWGKRNRQFNTLQYDRIHSTQQKEGENA